MILYVLYLYSDNTNKDKTVTWNQDTILAATDANLTAADSAVVVDKAAADSTTAADSAEAVDNSADRAATVEKKDKKSKKFTKKDRNKTIRDPIKEDPATGELPGIKEAPATEELPDLDKEQIIHQQNQVIKNINNQSTCNTKHLLFTYKTRI